MQYNQYSTISKTYITSKIKEFLIEDMPTGDITTEIIIPNRKIIKANIQAQESMYFSGYEIIPHCFGKNCKTTLYKKDGEFIHKNEILGSIKGPAQHILSRERVMLNLIQRLCGITSLTNEFSTMAKPYNIKILDTRKVTPGLRLFEKYAVAVGGGYNHRLNLSEGILIKDNHIQTLGSIDKVLKKINNNDTKYDVEIEIDNIKQLKIALNHNINAFLLDNMSPNIIKKAVNLIREKEDHNKYFIEVSGGINLSNLKSYLPLNINAISIGALTHSAINKNIHLEFI